MVSKGNSRAVILYYIDFKVIGILTTHLEHYPSNTLPYLIYLSRHFTPKIFLLAHLYINLRTL